MRSGGMKITSIIIFRVYIEFFRLNKVQQAPLPFFTHKHTHSLAGEDQAKMTISSLEIRKPRTIQNRICLMPSFKHYIL